MHAKLYFDGVSNGELSYADMFDDIVAVLCGETDINNLAAATLGAEGHLVSSVAAGWRLESRDETTTNGHIFYILSSLVSGATTKRKYVLFRLNTSTGEYRVIFSDAITTTYSLRNTKNDYEIAYYHFDSNQLFINNSKAFYFYISANSQCIGLMTSHSSSMSALRLFEFEWNPNLKRVPLPDEDWCPMCGYVTTSAIKSTSYNLATTPLPNPWTDADIHMNSIGTSNSDIDYAGQYGVSAYIGLNVPWANGNLAKAAITQADESVPYIFHKPIVGSGRVVAGKMHSNVPWYRIDDDGAPSNTPGDEVTISPQGGGSSRTFIVWASAWGTTTSAPLYVEKI
jgi:hypothetical protein